MVMHIKINANLYVTKMTWRACDACSMDVLNQIRNVKYEKDLFVTSYIVRKNHIRFLLLES